MAQAAFGPGVGPERLRTGKLSTHICSHLPLVRLFDPGDEHWPAWGLGSSRPGPKEVIHAYLVTHAAGEAGLAPISGALASVGD